MGGVCVGRSVCWEELDMWEECVLVGRGRRSACTREILQWQPFNRSVWEEGGEGDAGEKDCGGPGTRNHSRCMDWNRRQDGWRCVIR